MHELSRCAVPGGSVEYSDVPGDPSLAPLLFLHEGLGSVRLWRAFPERVAAATGRRTVVYSRLGHGGSDLPGAPRPHRQLLQEEAAVVVPALRAALGLDAPVLVGHSDGGSIALLHAALSSPAAPVTALVVLAPHVLVEEVGLRAIARARRDFDEGDLRSRMARHHRDPDVTFRRWNDGWLDEGFRSWDIRGELAGITCPVLAVQGTDDPYGTLVHVEEVRDRARGPVDLQVLDCGHAPHLERPAEVQEAITAFLRALP